MTERKRFAITVARVEMDAAVTVVHIPWDQYVTPATREAYAILIEGSGANAVVVSKSPEGRWASSTRHKEPWRSICRATPMESMAWRTMAVESDWYPWESVGT